MIKYKYKKIIKIIIIETIQEEIFNGKKKENYGRQ